MNWIFLKKLLDCYLIFIYSLHLSMLFIFFFLTVYKHFTKVSECEILKRLKNMFIYTVFYFAFLNEFCRNIFEVRIMNLNSCLMRTIHVVSRLRGEGATFVRCMLRINLAKPNFHSKQGSIYWAGILRQNVNKASSLWLKLRHSLCMESLVKVWNFLRIYTFVANYKIGICYNFVATYVKLTSF